ncbi:hypothetical protein [Leptospira sp. GIMC2001]|uniref:hypothetical protein n=1 Tax=Leptospira sp. GIMC2001 TaxID=1513297 RepID=UPI0023499FB6|nr:hypothetical protein [Leptospira sp. GIMC2001]WCL51039.1 hypothetical protein O4O04_09565 [Leptospira sp. GIMC2001]
MERKDPEQYLSVHCEYFSKGEFEPYPVWKEKWGMYVMLGSLLADVGILYGLAVANGWYAFGYFSIGYPLAAAERFPLNPQGFGSWCGKPDAPLTPPADYYYATSIPKEDTCEPWDDSSLRKILRQALIDPDIYSIHDDEIQRIITNQEISLHIEFLPSNKRCLHTLYVKGGHDSLREIFKAKKRLNGD